MRAAYAFVKEREVDWGYLERLCTVVGDARTRSNFLTDVRIELESQMALGLLQDRNNPLYYEHTSPRSNYLLLDGGGYFGGERKFRVSLYERCEKDGVNLLAISKNSPSLHDDKGRDFIATTSMLSSQGIRVYHLIREALRHGQAPQTAERSRVSFSAMNQAAWFSVFFKSFSISFLTQYLNGILPVSLSK